MRARSRAQIVRRLVALIACLVAAWSLAATDVVSRVAELVAAIGTPPGPADAVVRRSADDFECPPGAELRRGEAAGGGAALWCEAPDGPRSVRQGAYLELYPDGTTARQGSYERGMQVDAWVRWTPGGEVAKLTALVPGEASRFIPNPEDLCPAGATRARSFGFDDRPRMWSSCVAVTAGGARVLQGPYVVWDEVPGPRGPRYLLREITTYRDDERHGPHLVFEGPFGRESLVERDTYDSGRLEGDSLAFYRDGTPREARHYRHNELDGVRVGYAPDGSERWRVSYAQGRWIAAEGDLTVAGQPCPEPTVPTFSADGRELFCARRQQHFLVREGPFVAWDADGNVEESGLYENDEKKELWAAPVGVELPPKVGDDVQVAEIELRLGDEAYAPDVAARPAGATKPYNIWFRDNRTKKYPYPRTALRDSVVEVYGLPPGSYYMEIDIDANPANQLQWPGDLVAALDFRVSARETTRKPARLLYTLHLLAPRDNDQSIPGWGYPCQDEKAVLAGPVRFAWQRPPLAAGIPLEYVYRLTRRDCDSNREIAAVDTTTFDTEATLDLPPSRPGEHYEWSLAARASGQPVGQLMTFGEGGGYGWSLAFRVE